MANNDLVIFPFKLYDISLKLKMEIPVTIYKMNCLLCDSIRSIFWEIPSLMLYVVWAAGEVPK